MRSVAFYDPACRDPYCARTLSEAATGGTEATVVRIAEALDARVIQHNRTAPEGRYLPPQRLAEIEHLVVLRDPRPLQRLHESFPQARLYLWVHDLLAPGSKRGRRLAAQAATLRALGVTIICVSDFQRHQVEAVLARAVPAGGVATVTLYNIVDDALCPDDTAVDPAKLVFFSSPNKGLGFALDAFARLRRKMPDLRLHVGSPGYKSLKRAHLQRRIHLNGVHWLGALPHARIMAEVRSALCVFYPNFVLPETFGLVFAEANALGTPVLTHACGSAAEVLADPRQILPLTMAQRAYERTARTLPAACRPLLARCGARLGVFDPYVERIAAWREGARPTPAPDPRFRLSAVVERWRALFSDPPLGGKTQADAAVATATHPLVN